MLYSPNSHSERLCLDYARDFMAIHGRQIDLLSINTIEGDAQATLYDITSYPAVLALDSQGKLLNIWKGEMLPVMNELLAYAN
jgi:hypothetical protein